MITPDVREKYAIESRTYGFDFSAQPELQGTDTLDNPVVTSAPAGLMVGTPFVLGKLVIVTIGGGTAGTTYALICSVHVVTANVTMAIEGKMKVLKE